MKCKRGHERERGKECKFCHNIRLAWRMCSRCKIQFKPERNQIGSKFAHCPDCWRKHPDECQKLLRQGYQHDCPDCGKRINKDSKLCLACKRKAAHAAVLIHCSLCSAAYKPRNFKKSLHARVVFCPTCFKNRRAEVARITAAARKQSSKSGGMRTSDRVVVRLIAEAMGSVRTVFDRERGVGAVPENLKRYLDDPNTYKTIQWRGRPAIVRASA